MTLFAIAEALAGETPALEAPEAPAELPPLTREPAVLEFVQAPYPPEAEAAGIEGTVLLLVTIDATGAVTDVFVSQPAGHGFDAAAVEAMRRFRFSPAEDATGPVPVEIEFEYGFALKQEVAPAEAVAPIVLDGTLKEMATRAPIAGAVIQAVDGETVLAEAPTDAHGRFDLRGLAPGRVKLRMRRPGYKDGEATVEVTAGELTSVTLWLKNLSYRDNEVVAVYERERAPEVTRRTLSMAEVRRVPGTFGDPVRVIQSLPGAARAPFSTGLLVLRGANPEDSNVYVDGVEVPLVYHLGGFRSILNPELIEAVDYLPGTYSARYGRSTGGVIDVRTQSEYPEKTHLSLRTDLLDTGAYGEGRVGKVGFAAGVRRSYIDAVLGVALADEEFYAAPRWFDYQLKLEALDAGRSELSAFVFGFDDSLIVRTSADADDALGVNYSTHRVALRWARPLSDTLTLEVRPAVGIDGATLGFGSQFGFEITSFKVNLRSELAWRPSDALTLTTGLDAEANRTDFAISIGSVAVDGEDPNSESEPFATEAGTWQFTPDPWVEAAFRPLEDPDRLVVAGGARLDLLARSEQDVALAVDPRIAARAQLVEGGTLKGGTGLYHQPPQGIDLGFGTGYERAWASELGWEQKLGPAIQADLTGFHRSMDRLIVAGDLEDADGGEPGIGRAYGMEVMIRHALVDRFFGWVSYTLSHSERNDDPDDPDGWYDFDFDQTHILTAVAGYRLPLDFEVSARAQYVTGNPYTPYDGGLYQMDEGSYVGFPSSETNSARMDPFYAVDLRVDKTFTFKHWQLEVFTDILNAVHGTNPEFILYNYDYTESSVIGGLPLIPSFGFQAEVNL